MRAVLLSAVIALLSAPALAQEPEPLTESHRDTRPPIAPDIREDETRLKLQRGDFVVVPIPISNPTLDSGLVGFAGSGYIGGTLREFKEREAVPSYGAGLRFMVLPAKRINIRLDFAWSTDSDAIHLSVGEAF